MPDQFVSTTPFDPRARPLADQLTQEYVTRYGSYFGDPPGAEMTRYPPEVFAGPDGHFLLLLRDGVAIAGGAFKRLDARTAELKRVWTDTAFRRQGLARRVVAELEAQAVRQGYGRAYLTTGFRQPEAKGLYLGLGYTPLFDIDVDPETYGILPFEKALPGAALTQTGPQRTAA
ncbi:GNAT family N-acetyltransferase [Methylobacterium indicum]|uniref:N-acetyltransferase n=1 Tax=Methylobacterium indicum TaxID=1775910 RepID=A0A8H8WT90_9HYPH|nr:GNAT family N-acetyltransferase [Methylobacterium indicum]BCM83844.1 N-acetyltransferase [Methylobacterium indicum]